MCSAYRSASGAAAAVATTVIAPSASTPRVKIRWSYASPRSPSRRAALTSNGTTTLVRMPPSIRLYTALGSVLAML